MLKQLNEVADFNPQTADNFFTKSYKKYLHLGAKFNDTPILVNLNDIIQYDEVFNNEGRETPHTPLEWQRLATDFGNGIKPWLDLPIVVKNTDKDIDKKYKVGEIYEGSIVKIVDYGAFCSLENSVEGLIHNSELSWTNRNIQPSKVLSASQSIKIKIVSIDVDAKRISLSYKATLENPWEKISDQIGEEQKIKVTNVTNKAVFGELVDSKLPGNSLWAWEFHPLKLRLCLSQTL